MHPKNIHTPPWGHLWCDINVVLNAWRRIYSIYYIRLWANWNAGGGVCILAIRYPVGNRFLAHLHSCNIHFLLAYLHTCVLGSTTNIQHTHTIPKISNTHSAFIISRTCIRTLNTYLHTCMLHICSTFLSLNTLPPLHCVPVHLDTCKKNSLAQTCQHSTTST